ncbi:MAG: UvrD-helicase domain-containing protein, partial [Alphaproteobacteria bacterium]|nr:UvrD-helicase domain-containing protein [Alphaproteobacteria bacterium]
MAQLIVMPGAARPRPTPEQHLAADPESSVWVSASAGTGKTRVLSNRLLRLLLAGNDPAAILCLTYTKAGAAEMARRVQQDLAGLAVMPRDELTAALEGLLDRAPGAGEIDRARGGLLAVLDLPAGLRIMTIHSFCQSLLYRFPLEAGVSPHFELLEPRAAAALRERARDEVLIDRAPAVRAAIDRLAVALGEHSLSEGLSALDGRRAELTRMLAEHDGDVDALIAGVYGALGVEPGMTVNDLRVAVCSDPERDEPALLAAASALASGKKTDVEAANKIRAWIEAEHDGRLSQISDYQQAFLTKDKKPRKKLANKDVSDGFPHVMPVLEAEQARLLAAAEREKAVGVAEKTGALLCVGAAIIQAYERRKQAQGVLDYTDLIDKSQALLTDQDAGAWVRYKLDQRIDHLLIDESQDTSPDQWEIIQALIDDFWSGEGAREKPPTLFVVGDEKQSIFGFQGADVETYQRLRGRFEERALGARRRWGDVPLAQSFRSAQAILDVVDAVFDKEAAVGAHCGAEPMKHRAFKQDAKGLVEVWPLIGPDQPEDEAVDGWALPDQATVADSAELRLARNIAEQIRCWLLDRTPLANKDRPIEPGDIMILLPRRGVLQDRIIRELKKNDVPVAGADRIGLTDELAVMDLMALGDALLLPEDDLTVATLLRSPLFDFSDEQLFRLAHDRGERPLYRRLTDLRDTDPAFAKADDRLRALLAVVDYAPPFEFFSRFLAEGASNGRRRLLRRLGPAAILPIEAFLAQAIAYEKSHPPSMQGFLHWLRADSEAIKRDVQESAKEVRILTVHGAKGLEAPIVFLADATYRKTMQKDRLLWRDDGLPLWKMPERDRDRHS